MKTIRLLVPRFVLTCLLLVISASLRAAEDFGAGIYMGQCENLTMRGKALMRLTVITRKGDNFTGHLEITGELEGTGEVTGTLTKDVADFSLIDKEAGYTIRFKASKRDTAALSGSYEVDMPNPPSRFPKKQIGTWRIEQVAQENLARLKAEEAKLETSLKLPFTEKDVAKQLTELLNGYELTPPLGVSVRRPQLLFNAFHPAGTARGIEVDKVEFEWKSTERHYDPGQIKNIRVEFTLHWDGPVKQGYTSFMVKFDPDTGEMSSPKLVATNGITNDQAVNVAFKIGAIVGAILLRDN